MNDAPLRQFAEGDFAEWAGLPDDVTADELRRLWGGADQAIPGRLSSQPATRRLYRCPRQSRDITAWFDDHGTLKLLTMDLPLIKGDLSGLLESLGPPDRKLSAHIGYHADAHQWICARHGLTLFIREHNNEIARPPLIEV